MGKKLYHSTSIWMFKFFALTITGVLFLNLNFQTLKSDVFQSYTLTHTGSKIDQVLSFHFAYPQEYIFFILVIVIPTLYYSFIRGVSFYEKGIVINKGLPFFNVVVKYDQIDSFELIHSKFFISITHKETGDETLFAVKDADRALAILDQNGIKGDLGIKTRANSSAQVKLFCFFIGAGVVMALVQYSGFIRSLLK